MRLSRSASLVLVVVLAACHHEHGNPDTGVPGDLAIDAAVPSDAGTDAARAPDAAIDDDGGTSTCGDGGTGPSITALAAGGVNTCIVRSDHTLWCWGVNDHGQLGDGTTNPAKTPTQVAALGANVIGVGIGSDSHICAIMVDHTLRCAGDNELGSLGDGTTSGSMTFVTPSIADVVEVKAGIEFTCARKSDGTVWCWGDNTDGQIGDGSSMQRTAPVQVTTLGTSVAQIAAGWEHACARKTDGSVWCWGGNGAGMVGDGTFNNAPAPVQLTTLTNVVQLGADAYDTCAVRSDGSDYCWGQDHDGQLNDGNMAGTGAPELMSAIGSSVAAGQCGFSGTYAVKSDHTVWYWGYSMLTGITQVPNVTVDVLVTGDDHECALDGAGTLLCWGDNTSYQLGDGTLNGRAAPAPVVLPCP
jgi:hypothetical protein